MESDPHSIDVDAGFMGEQVFFNPLFRVFQSPVGILVEVEDRARADWHLHLVKKMVLNAVVWDQLILRHINRIDLDHNFRGRVINLHMRPG